MKIIRKNLEIYGFTVEIKYLDNNGTIIDFPVNYDISFSFKYKKYVIGRTGNYGTKSTEIWVPLKYLGNFWRSLEIL